MTLAYEHEDVITMRQTANSNYSKIGLLSEDQQSMASRNNTTMVDVNDDVNPFYLFGICLLLPWNAILAAMDFFQLKFPKEEGFNPSFALLVAVSAPMLAV